MKTKITNRGQIALPVSVRRLLSLRSGNILDLEVSAGRIILTPRRARPHNAKILIDPITGLPVLSAGPGVPKLTSHEVEEILYAV